MVELEFLTGCSDATNIQVDYENKNLLLEEVPLANLSIKKSAVSQLNSIEELSNLHSFFLSKRIYAYGLSMALTDGKHSIICSVNLLIKGNNGLKINYSKVTQNSLLVEWLVPFQTEFPPVLFQALAGRLPDTGCSHSRLGFEGSEITSFF